MKVEKEKITIAVKTGKSVFGGKSVCKTLLNDEFRLVIISANCPANLQEQMTYYCQIASTPIIQSEYSASELAAICTRNHPLNAIGIIDAGDSDILNALPGN